MAARFPTTHWSRLGRVGDRSGPEALAALERLCRDYWFPLYAFIRARGHTAHESEDLVQGFLADILERGDLARLDQSNGRFRSFLRAACDHYLANCRDHDRAAKRGGAVSIVAIDRLEAEHRYARELAHELTPEMHFECEWALALLRTCSSDCEPSRFRQGRVYFSSGCSLRFKETLSHPLIGRSATIWV